MKETETENLNLKGTIITVSHIYTQRYLLLPPSSASSSTTTTAVLLVVVAVVAVVERTH
jgi:hypothetical protein